MSELIDKGALLKEYDKLPVQKVDYVDCGDAYRNRPLVDLARVHTMIEDAPTTSEAEIRAKVVDEFVEKLRSMAKEDYGFRNFLEESWSSDFSCMHFLTIVDEIAEQMKERE